MVLDQGARYDADVMLLGQGAVSVKVGAPLATQRDELRVFRHPAGQVVFGQHGEVGAEGGGGGDIFGSFLMVTLDSEGLGGRKRGGVSGDCKESWETNEDGDVYLGV